MDLHVPKGHSLGFAGTTCPSKAGRHPASVLGVFTEILSNARQASRETTVRGRGKVKALSAREVVDKVRPRGDIPDQPG